MLELQLKTIVPLHRQISGIDMVDVLSLNRTNDGRTQYPEVRDEIYHFNSHPHPITWSIDVEIQPVGSVPER